MAARLDRDEVRIRIGRRLRSLRIAADKTIEDVARTLGISRWSLMRIEAGQSSVPLEVLPSLCAALATTTTDLFPAGHRPPVRQAA